MSAMIPFFSSCSDDDSVNEWDMSYVSLLPADYLRPTPSFTLKHVEEEKKVLKAVLSFSLWLQHKKLLPRI